MKEEFSDSLYFSINNLSRMLFGMADREFKDIGLAPSYAFLLMTVVKNPGIQPSELSDILGLKPSTITRLIDKMETRNYLERNSEGRATHVHPTEKCLAKDKEIRNAWQKLKEKYSGTLGERYTNVLTEMSLKAIEQLKNK